MRTTSLLVPLVLLTAIGCKDGGSTDTSNPDDTGPSTSAEDADGDGYTADVDCDDDDADVHPDADEVCNGEDDNCDGEADEGITVTWYVDRDGDGYGDEGTTQDSCDELSGMVTDGTDCNDDDETMYPGADEYCDSADNDCDGDVDEDAVDQSTLYEDADGDGVGVEDGKSVTGCDSEDGYAAEVGDCDDADASRYPGAGELCDGIDNDCDEKTTEDGAVAIEGGGSYGSIQEAIDAAAKGDTIQVCTGEFIEALEIGQDITLVGAGADVTTIDARGGGAVIAVGSGVSIDVSGMTLTGGTGDPYPKEPLISVGGGVWAFSAGDLAFTDVVFEDNEPDYGGGMFVEVADSITLNGVTMQDNLAGYAGGIWGTTVGTLEITDSVIDDNYAVARGGALYLVGLDLLSITDSSISGNTAGNGAAGLVATVTDATLTGVEILQNEAVGDGSSCYGGAFWTEGVTWDTVDTTVGYNSAADSYGGQSLGGGILLVDAIWMGGEVLENNADFGAGFFTYSSGAADTATIQDAVVRDNVANGSGGGVYMQGDLDCDASSFESNDALYAGGAYVQAGSDYSAEFDGNDTCTISDNYAEYYGGGVYVTEDLEPADLVGFTISGNNAAYGGGVFAGGGSLEDLDVSGNSATYGGGVYGVGSVSLSDSSVSSNEAEYGGGLVSDSGELILDSITVEGNAASESGGGAFLWASSTLVSYSSDWGEGVSDNEPEDIAGDGALETYDYGSSEDFTCENTALGGDSGFPGPADAPGIDTGSGEDTGRPPLPGDDTAEDTGRPPLPGDTGDTGDTGEPAEEATAELVCE